MPSGMLPASLSAQHGYEVPEPTLEEQGCWLTIGNMTDTDRFMYIHTILREAGLC